MLRCPVGIALAALLIASLADAQERTLYWKSLAVEARLEPTGAMHVTERHHIVFNGSWNGGERPFRTGAQRPELISLTRVDPRTNEVYPLRAASTAAMGVDEYAWVGTNLRWRTRRPTDPAFRNHAAIYVVDYRLYDVVFPDGDRYRIAHDFAFTGRPGAIERFSLALDLDPGWEAAPGVSFPLERLNLGRDQTVNLKIPIRWQGRGRPRYVGRDDATRAAAAERARLPAVPPPPPPPPPLANRLAPLALFVVLAGLMTYWFLRREEAAGAYGRSPDITIEWLEENVFRHRAEVIGAAWDGETGHAEAAALISILIGEGKIANIPGAPPRLKLLVPRDGLVEYERAFVDRLFVAGDEIDPDTLRRHYAATGFDPAAAIRAPLESAARELVGASTSRGGVALGGVASAVIVLLVLPLAGIYLLTDDWMLPFMAGIVLFTLSISLAGLYRTKLKGRAWAALIPVPLFAMAGVLGVNLTNVTAIEVFLTLTLLLLALAFLAARSTGSPRDHENLRALRAARTYFKRRLRQRDADVDERWVPYLLAFGLGKDLDRWAVAAPRRDRAADRDWPTDSDRTRGDAGAGTSGTSGPSFHPGGGAFGGAGATGSWASSIGSFAAVVAAPAPARDSSGSSSSDWSSSSSDSSSGGGSDSGGGSGGGW